MTCQARQPPATCASSSAAASSSTAPVRRRCRGTWWCAAAPSNRSGSAAALGLLTPGYHADVLVVDGNPVQDVTVLQDPANLLAIVQGGRFHKRAERLELATA